MLNFRTLDLNLLRVFNALMSEGSLTRAASALAAFRPETVVLISPHAPLSADAFLVDTSDSFSGSLVQFGDEQHYSWPRIIAQYAALFAELGGR